MDEETMDEMMEDCISLIDKYEDGNVGITLGAFMMILTKMISDGAPDHDAAVKIIKIAVEEGFEWSKSEKEDSL